MVVVEVARGLDAKKRTRTRTADICDKEGGKRKVLVIMARDAPEKKMTKHQHCRKRQLPYPIPTHSYQCTPVVSSLEDRQSYYDTQPNETRTNKAQTYRDPKLRQFPI